MRNGRCCQATLQAVSVRFMHGYWACLIGATACTISWTEPRQTGRQNAGRCMRATSSPSAGHPDRPSSSAPPRWPFVTSPDQGRPAAGSARRALLARTRHSDPSPSRIAVLSRHHLWSGDPGSDPPHPANGSGRRATCFAGSEDRAVVRHREVLCIELERDRHHRTFKPPAGRGDAFTCAGSATVSGAGIGPTWTLVVASDSRQAEQAP